MHIKTREEWSEERDELLETLVEFAHVMEKRPFQNEAGLRGVSAFALYWFVKKLQPDIVFEVGVWRGFSTWLIEQAAPEAEIWAFDPIFFFGGEPQPVYRTPRAQYFREDFSCADLSGVVADARMPLAFFDDHHRQIARVEQCRRVGIKHLVFDDNPPCPYSNRTLEDERTEGAPVFQEMIDRYEVFPALWAIDDETEYAIVEEGLDFPVTDELSYLYGERKWHSYVTYVKATEQSQPSARELRSSTRLGGMSPVQLVSSAPPPAPTDDEMAEQVRRLAAASSAAITALDARIRSLESGLANVAQSA